MSQVWWQAPVISAAQEAEAGESLEPRRRRLQGDKVVVSQDHTIALLPGQQEQNSTSKKKKLIMEINVIPTWMKQSAAEEKSEIRHFVQRKEYWATSEETHILFLAQLTNRLVIPALRSSSPSQIPEAKSVGPTYRTVPISFELDLRPLLQLHAPFNAPCSGSAAPTATQSSFRSVQKGKVGKTLQCQSHNIQLAHEPHRFEVRGSTYTQRFFRLCTQDSKTDPFSPSSSSACTKNVSKHSPAPRPDDKAQGSLVRSAKASGPHCPRAASTVHWK
ncbi:LOW QUALITY PROTEIN: hypothetical protein AAY473_009187 [Plecturocebus cupreus]